MFRNFIAPVLVFIFFCLTTAFVVYNTGVAGYTGAPGEGTCNTCHGGGSSSASGVTLTSIPSFSLDQYKPDSTYQITISVSAAGFNKYGFGCEILNNSLVNAGTMKNAGAGVKFLNAFNGRRNAVHTTGKFGASVNFSFQWTAPSVPDTVTIYVMCNAVNANNNTGGDFPLQPFQLSLTPVPVPQDTSNVDTTSIREISAAVKRVSVYPNPARDIAEVSYTLEKGGDVVVSVYSVSGKLAREERFSQVAPGAHSAFIDIHRLARGAYFVCVTGPDDRPVRKLLIAD
jgi:hypothetical protein